MTDCSNPEELRRGLAGWVDERTGIIRYLALNAPDDMGPDLPLTSTAVLSNYTEGEFRRQDLSLGSGKGLTDLQAMIGAVGEAIERYSASRYHGDSLIHCPMHDLPGDYLDPRDLGLYDEHQYAVDGFPFVRFDPAQSIHWTQGTWLDSRKPVWLPALPTYFNFRTPRNEQFCQVSSNGLAAGMSLADASLRAIFELVERDAFMISWHCRLPGQRIELDKSLGVGVLEIVRQLKELGAQIELYWMTAGIAIPVVACLGVGDGVHWPGVSVSLAAHASIGTAAHKAILEQGAIGPYIRRMMMDGLPIPDTPEDVHSLNDHALFYVPIERRVAFDFLRTDSSNAVLLSDVEVPHEASLVWCAEHLARGGVRVAIADVTSSDLSGSGFAVARALGTSIQSIDFGFNLRRLTNPRLKQQLTSEPNPFPHPLA